MSADAPENTPVTNGDSRAGDSGSGESSGDKARRFRRTITIIAAVAIVVFAIWFIRYLTHGKFQETTNDAYVQTDAITIAPKVSGYVDRVFVTENQSVKAGQPLVQIDARDYHAQAAQSTAQIDASRANAAGVVAQIGEQRAAIEQARADLDAAIAASAHADREAARYRPLAASGAETRERLSDVENQATQAHAKVDAARAALDSAERRIGTLRAQVKQAEAQGEAARAQLSAASVDVQATMLRASVDGRIGDKSVRQGQFVQAATRMMTLVPDSSLYVTANFKETQLGRIRPGQVAIVSVDALPGAELRGRVASISPGTGAQFSILPPQNATGNFTKIVQRIPVRIAIDAKPETRRLLIPGMSVEVRIDVRTGPKDGQAAR